MYKELFLLLGHVFYSYNVSPHSVLEKFDSVYCILTTDIWKVGTWFLHIVKIIKRTKYKNIDKNIDTRKWEL